MVAFSKEILRRPFDRFNRDNALVVQAWPDYPAGALEDAGDDAAAAEIGWVIDLISEIRSVRSEMHVPAKA